jgi:hypothetical protein
VMTDEQPLGQAGDRLRIERQRNGLRRERFAGGPAAAGACATASAEPRAAAPRVTIAPAARRLRRSIVGSSGVSFEMAVAGHPTSPAR